MKPIGAARALSAAIVALVVVQAPLAPGLHAQQPRAERQRSMYVSVVDESGAPVPNLGPSDFIVREDNVTREVLKVAPATEPMTIAVLVDNSTAANKYIMDIRPGLEGFVKTMTGPSEIQGKNQIAIIGVADRPTILADYTIDAAQAIKGVNRIFTQPQSGMVLLDAIIETSKGLKKRGADRSVILAVTSEGPELSDRYYDFVLEPLKASSAAFYVITLGPMSSSLSDNARNRGVVFDQGTSSTGGSLQMLLASTALKGALDKLADQLLHEYRITYAHPETLIPPEKITVTAAKPGMTARGTPINEPQGKP
jgi:hypothetical protein